MCICFILVKVIRRVLFFILGIGVVVVNFERKIFYFLEGFFFFIMFIFFFFFYIKIIDFVCIILLKIIFSLFVVNISVFVRVMWWVFSGNILNVIFGLYKYLLVVYIIVLLIFLVDFCCLKLNCNIYGILIFIKNKNLIY